MRKMKNNTVTIRHENLVYHGVILKWVALDIFIFAFRANGRNYVWECKRDYREVIL